jgi:hypothetical protein
MNAITLTDTETKLMLQVLSNLNVNPAAPDSAVICGAIQSILAKIKEAVELQAPEIPADVTQPEMSAEAAPGVSQ